MWSDEILKHTTTFGALGYELSKCLLILDLNDDLTTKYSTDFFEKDSPIGKAYQKGIILEEFSIDSKLFDMARAGDIKSLKELNQRKHKRKLKKI